MGRRTIGLGIALAVGAEAWAGGDPSAKIQAYVDEGKPDVARKKCEEWGGLKEGAAAPLREVCGWIWYGDAEKADTVDAYATFRGQWGDTSWAKDALKHESDLALSALGYDATEADYKAIADRYPGTEAGELARERAGERALASIATRDDVLRVAKAYDELLPRLLEKHLDAFVHATVTATTATVTVDPPAIAPSALRTSWVSHEASGDRPWGEHVFLALGAHGIDLSELGDVQSADGAGPSFPLCYDPASGDAKPGVLVEGAGGHAFFPSPWADGCGPDAPAVWATVRDAALVELATNPDRHVRLNAGDGPWQDVRALAAPTGDPVLAGDRVLTPTATAVVAQSILGGEPWLEAGTVPAGHRLRYGLATAWVPAGFQLTVGSGPQDVLGADGRAWHLAPGDHWAIVPMVARFLGLQGLPAAPPLPAPLAKWAGATPPGATPLKPEKGDVAALAARLQALGVAGVSLSAASTADVDGDGVADTIAEGSLAGRRVVVVAMGTAPPADPATAPAGPATSPAEGRLYAWVAKDVTKTPPKASWFTLDGRAAVAWTASKTPTTVLRWDGIGPTLDVLP